MRGVMSSFVFNHNAVPVFHDHMDGSAHCVECAGICRLTDPTQQALTSIIRHLFESEVVRGNPALPCSVTAALERHGININTLRKRARESGLGTTTKKDLT